MGNVIGINLPDERIYVLNGGTLINSINSFTIYNCASKGAIVSAISSWSTVVSTNSTDANRIDVTFTYDSGTFDLGVVSGLMNIGYVSGITTGLDLTSTNISWKTSSAGAVNYQNNVELDSSLLHTINKSLFNNNIIFTTNNYFINFKKTILEDYEPNSLVNDSDVSLQEYGHLIVTIDSVQLTPGIWFITGNGTFDVRNKKYFYFSDKDAEDYNTNPKYYYDALASDEQLMKSFGTYQTANTNMLSITTSMTYVATKKTVPIYWCFTCSDDNSSDTAFDSTISTSNSTVDNTKNNYTLTAIKISS